MRSCACGEICDACRAGVPRAAKDLWLATFRTHARAQGGRPPADLALADGEGVFARWVFGLGEFRYARAPRSPEEAYGWFELTTACDQVCRHCFLGERLRHGHVPMADISLALCAAHEAGVFEVVLSGGEPTLHPRFCDIVRLTRQMFRRVRVLTNGRTHRDDVVEVLAHPSIVVEVPLLAVGSTHDFLTGVPGSFERAVETIGVLKARGVEVWLTTTLTRFAVADLERLRALAAELGVPFQASRLFPLGRARERWAELAPSLPPEVLAEVS